MNGLAGGPFLFDRSIELALKIELSDLCLGSIEQSVILCGIHRTDGCSGGRTQAAEASNLRRRPVCRLGGLRWAVDAEGREADGTMTKRIEEVTTEGGVKMAFRKEERVVGAAIGGYDIAEKREVVGVEIWREDIDRRRGCLPDCDVGLLRSAGWIFLASARAIAVFQRVDGISKPHVAVHGERILGLARSRHFVDVVCGGIRSEALVRVRAKRRDPVPGPEVERAGKVRRGIGLKGLLRGGREVSDGADRTRLILHQIGRAHV